MNFLIFPYLLIDRCTGVDDFDDVTERLGVASLVFCVFLYCFFVINETISQRSCPDSESDDNSKTSLL